MQILQVIFEKMNVDKEVVQCFDCIERLNWFKVSSLLSYRTIR